MLSISTNRNTARTQGELAALQQAICNAAASDPAINRYAWNFEQQEDIASAIRAGIAKTGGWCTVLTLTGRCRTQDTTEGLLLDNVTVVIAVGENVSLNRGPAGTQIPITRQVEQVARVLHGSDIDSSFILTFDDFGVMTGREPGMMLYQVRFSTSALLTAQGE